MEEICLKPLDTQKLKVKEWKILNNANNQKKIDSYINIKQIEKYHY